MQKVVKVQTNFSLGEISPKMYGSFDLEQYGAALKTCTNFIPSHLRSLSRRPGTYFIKEVIDQNKDSRLIPFQYSNEQSYVLEFNDEQCRFFKDQGLILQARGITNGNFNSGISGWNDNSVPSATISYDSINDTLQLNGGGGATFAIATHDVITNAGTGVYTFTATVTGAAVVLRIGSSALVADIAITSLPVGTTSYNFNSNINQNIYISLLTADVADVDNITLVSSGYQIDVPYEDEDIQDLQYEQSFNVLYIAHPNYKPGKITRYGHDNWTFEYIDFNEYPYMDKNKTDITFTPSDVSGTITLTASDDIFVDTDIGRVVRYRSGDELISGVNLIDYPGSGSQIYFDIPFYPQTSDNVTVVLVDATGARTTKTYTASSTPTSGQFTIIDGQVKTGFTASETDLVQIYKTNAGSGIWGWGVITGFSDATEVTLLVQSVLTGTAASTQWRLGAWSETTSYPACVALFEQRLWWGNTEAQPNTLWGSRTGDFEEYSPDNDDKKGQVDDDTAVTFTLTTPAIRWIRGTQALVCGCQNGIIQITGSNGPITASTPFTRKDLSIESSKVLPCVAHNTVIYAEHLKKRIHALSYSLNTYGFQEADVSNFSDHLIGDSKIKSMMFSAVPNSLIWAITDDGRLLSCLFRPDKGLVGWSKHTLGGSNVQIRSMATIQGSDYSELWVVARRTIDGDTVDYIEVLQNDFEFQDIEDAFFVDSGISYDGSPIASFTNLDHLEGETVVVLADGMVHPDCVVTGGEITLNDSYSKVHAGLSYNSDLGTLNIEFNNSPGTAQIMKTRIYEVNAKLYNSINFKVGQDINSLTRKTFRETSDNIGESIPLFTGDYVFKYDGSFKTGSNILIRQDQPLPITLLSLTFKLEISDN